MLYIIDIKRNMREPDWYNLFETNTESFFGGELGLMQELIIKQGITVQNMTQINGELVLKDWVKRTHYTLGTKSYGTEYTLLCEVSKNKFKLVNYLGDMSYADLRQLNKLTSENKIANCEIKNGNIVSVDTYKIYEDTKLEKQIAEKYETYVAKTALLGRKMSFDYRIEGSQVNRWSVTKGYNRDW